MPADAVQFADAQELAQRLLEPLGQRWRHTCGVASRAAQASVLLCETELTTVVRAAWLHDLGHSPEITELGFHPLDGARYLAARGEDPVECQLVAYHSGAMVEAEVPATRVRLPRSSQPLTRCCCRC